DLTVTGVQTCALPIWRLTTELLHGAPLALAADDQAVAVERVGDPLALAAGWQRDASRLAAQCGHHVVAVHVPLVRGGVVAEDDRSEERRVGKEWRAGR